MITVNLNEITQSNVALIAAALITGETSNTETMTMEVEK